MTTTHEALGALPKRERTQIQDPADFSLLGARKGVTVYWLAQVFSLAPETVRKRLADLAPVAIEGKSNRYSVKEAAELLVEPKTDVMAAIRRMKPDDLPVDLQKEIWDAKLKRQKYELEAGELWRTEDVLEVLAQTFGVIKSTLQLWPDTVERTEGLTRPQRDVLVRLGDTLQDEVYNGLKDLAASKSKRSSLDLPDIEEMEEDDIDVEDLI